MKFYNFFLYPFACLYAFFAAFRNFLYDKKIIKSIRFDDIFIINVGNITVGGTGKTPMAEYLINILKDDFQVAFLSRGYRRKTKGFLLANENSTADQIGDEPFQVYSKFPEIIVAVAENRVDAVKKLLELKKLDVIILDDAFQHRKINPQLNILLTDFNRPFFDDCFLPAGRLRDNKSQYKRADIIIATKTPSNLYQEQKRKFIEKLKPLKYQQVFFTTIEYLFPIHFFTKKQISELRNFSILLVTGIANPIPLLEYLKKQTKNVIHLSFEDHHNYSRKDIEMFMKIFNSIPKKNKIILTTEKDYVKIKSLVKYFKISEFIYYLPIKPKFLFNLHQIFNHQIKTYVRKN